MNSPDTKRVFLVDGSGLVYRAHFAMLRNPLITTKGDNVSAVHGFLTTLLKLIREEQPDEIVVAFDVKGKTFRHEAYKEYKATRPPMPPELRMQIPKTKKLLETMGVAQVEMEGMEADDLIGSLARRAVEEGKEAIIVSADKDFMQLIDGSVRQWIPPKSQDSGQWVDSAGVVDRWGVDPGQMIDLLALMGDSSDNVPGVAGVGPKSASRLLQDFGTLDAIYDDLESVPQKGLRGKLEGGRDDAFLSRDLVRIRTDLEIDCSAESMQLPDLTAQPEFSEMLVELEFRRVIEQLGLEKTKAWGADYSLVRKSDELQGLLDRWRESGKPLSVAVQADDPDAPRSPAIGFAFSWESGRAFYVGFGHEVAGNIPGNAGIEAVRGLLGQEENVLVTHDWKNALHSLSLLEVETRASLRDTMLAAYLIDAESPNGFETLSIEQLEHKLIPLKEMTGVGKLRLSLRELGAASVAEYAAERADVTLRLYEKLTSQINDEALQRLFEEVECPLAVVLQRMEEAGIALDTGFLGTLSVEMEKELARLTEEIYEKAETNFNIASPSQLAHVLFDQLQLPKKKKTKTGYSTDHEVLEGLAELHPVPRLVLEHRSHSKLKSTYIDSLPELVGGDGRIHASFHQAVAATGRLSSSDPNIQNIPIRSETGRRIREAFIAGPDRVLISADYSQVELRILAHLSEDAGLKAAFDSGFDVHTATAARLFEVEPEAVGIELRSRSKAINFGVIYGMGPQRISREIGVSLVEAKSFIEDYFAAMPGVRGYLESNLEFARSHGYVETLLGRRRILRGINSSDQRARAQAERICSNTPIQGSAADVVKLAMLRVDRELRAAESSARLLLQVHDELVVEASAGETDQIAALLRTCMEDAIELAVPLQVELGMGRTWAEAHS